MKVLIVSEGDDIGGVAIAIKRGFDRHGGKGWEVRAMRGSNNYIDYPTDLDWDRPRFEELWEWADLIHSMEKVENLAGYRNPIDKPLVVHHHGTVYRDNHQTFINLVERHPFPQLVSTPDMTVYDPRTIWLPNPINMDWMREIKLEYALSDQRPFTVAHTPTQRWAKHTDIFISAFEWLKQHVPLAAMSIVEWKTWSESLVGKARGHILYDQIRDGYGLSAIEAASMGMPVLAGYMNQASRDISVPLLGGEFPFVETNETNIGEKMLALATDKKYYLESAQKGEEFVRNNHSDDVTVKRLKEIWTRACDEYKPSDEPW